MLAEPNILQKKSMANYGNKQHSLIKSINQTKQTNLLMSKSLVGDKIQRLKFNTRRGQDRAGGKFTLTTFLTNLHPGAISHT
jgi:hypothetical protein